MQPDRTVSSLPSRRPRFRCAPRHAPLPTSRPAPTRATLLALALAALALLPLPALAAEAADVAGYWEGAIQLPGAQLAVEVALSAEEGALAGTITIPQQGARDLPLTDLAVEGEAVTFTIAGVPGAPTFKGTLAADGATLAGDFTQGGATFSFSLARAESPAEEAEGALAGFADLVEDARQAWEVPGFAMAIVQRGEVVFAEGFGLRDVEAELPVTPDTLFAIGSCTKAFTTFVLGTLVDEGKLDWDEPVKEYLPGFQLYDEATTDLITPRDLVTHRSGLPRHDLLWYNNQDLPRAELVRRLRYLEPTATLRQKFQYNNLMVLAAGYLAEVLTGESWEENVRQRIFEPLGMERSNFAVEAMQEDGDFAQPYVERDDEVVRLPFRPLGNMGPAGSINSSVNEMARWVKLHLSGGKVGERRLIHAATLADIHAPHMPTGATPERADFSPSSYALGWVFNTYRGHQKLAHGGSIDGFVSVVTLFPQDGLGIVALANESGAALPGLMTRHAADRLLGLEPVEWNRDALAQRQAGKEVLEEAKAKKETVRRPGTEPAHPLADYAGTYEHPGYGTLEVALVDGQLQLIYNRITNPLEHWHYEVFSGTEGAEDPVFEGMKLQFETDVRGNVAAVKAPFDATLGAIAFTKRPDARYYDPEYLARFTGRYVIAGQVVTIELAGDELTFNAPGQPAYHLEPVLGGEFIFAEVPIISLRFTSDEAGEVTAVEVSQPEGVYTAQRQAP